MTQLSSGLILTVVFGYFIMLMIVSYFTGKDADNASFFTANKKSPWYLVAFGMIGASLSGVTFISIPGVVGAGGGNQAFSYMQMVMGYMVGYFVIATVLMPVYYRLNLTSIYGYLEDRFGVVSYKTGAAFFLMSRTIGASFRLYLVALVMDSFVTGPMGIPFAMTVAVTIILIWVYTFRGGIKTIVWTDTIQTVSMLAAVIFTIVAIGNHMGKGIGELWQMIGESGLNQVFFFEGGWSDANNFFKQFISGALIAIVMTGLDQDMMQKNLTCKTLGEAQKNIFSFSIVLIFANILFLSLGALLYIYAAHIGVEVPTKTDQLYPLLALKHLTPFIGIVFVIGLIAAAYSSADSALTSLTTSFCVDMLGFEKNDKTEAENKQTRFIVHVGFSILLFLVIILFNYINDAAVINGLFKVAGYTYGPLLGLYTFGLFTKMKIKDSLAIIVCVFAPCITYLFDYNSVNWFNGFKFGFMVLALNGLLTFVGLLLISDGRVENPVILDN